MASLLHGKVPYSAHVFFFKPDDITLRHAHILYFFFSSLKVSYRTQIQIFAFIVPMSCPIEKRNFCFRYVQCLAQAIMSDMPRSRTKSALKVPPIFVSFEKTKPFSSLLVENLLPFHKPIRNHHMPVLAALSDLMNILTPTSCQVVILCQKKHIKCLRRIDND